MTDEELAFWDMCVVGLAAAGACNTNEFSDPERIARIADKLLAERRKRRVAPRVKAAN